MRCSWILVFLLGACGRVASSGPDGGSSPADAPPQTCFGTLINQICLAALPTQGVTFDPPAAPANPITIIDTDSDKTGCAPTTGTGGSGYCVIAGTEISINADVHVIGTKPLILIATKTIIVTATTGILNVGSRRAPTDRTSYGAGADPGICLLGNAPTLRGGGAGGSFITAGGQGGNGAGSGPGTGGSPGSVSKPPDSVRGGCPGQTPGTPGSQTNGAGGGAVYLIAGDRITVDGKILAGGAGGRTGAPSSGVTSGPGGGGGSGGMIGLDAPTISVSGSLSAGGGGGGSSCVSGGTSHNGDDGASDDGTLVGDGGDCPGGPGSGGGGASATASGGNGVNAAPPTGNSDMSGGGGAGGGAGFILVPASASTAINMNPNVTPQATGRTPL